jgi:hypothetical protein
MTEEHLSARVEYDHMKTQTTDIIMKQKRKLERPQIAQSLKDASHPSI